VTHAIFYGKLTFMGNPAGVRRDFDELERRRMEAARLLRKGVAQAEVARRVGVHRQSVSRWATQLEEHGRAGLKKAGRAGRKPQLGGADLRKLERALKRGPEALGYATEMWTTGRVAELIEQEFGVAYHPGHVWRILRRLGWSCQRPSGRALERNEETIRWWKKEHWPAIKKKPRKSGVRSSSSTRAD
jgi:transposase